MKKINMKSDSDYEDELNEKEIKEENFLIDKFIKKSLNNV